MFWQRLRIKTTGDAKEAIFPILDRFGADGAELREEGGLCIIIAYVMWDTLSYRRIKNIKKSIRRLRAIGINIGSGGIKISAYDDGEPIPWSTIDPELPIPPTHAGRRVVIKGSSEAYAPEEGETVISIVPGRAWGTGHHPTTVMCIMAIEKYLKAGSRVIDLGCGTGILGMVAAGIGAREVLAIDVEEEALAHARLNVDANNLGHLVKLLRSDGLKSLKYSADLIVANLLGGLLEPLAAQFFEHLDEGGILICSGFDVKWRDDALDCMRHAGLELLEESLDDSWVALILQKPR
jgi:ribosomal protein L11 methyltransferase